jgi:hypothetical protein
VSAATPGQAAYEGFVAFQSDDDVQFETWEEKDENGDRDVMGRADWEAAGQAAQQPLRDGIAELLADVTKSADATRPSRKSQVEDELAIALRKLLEGK